MSVKNPPNFHAVKFQTIMIEAVEECLRGDAKIFRNSLPVAWELTEKFSNFALEVDDIVNKMVEKNHRQRLSNIK